MRSINNNKKYISFWVINGTFLNIFQTVCVRLADVAPANGNTLWSQASSQYLKNLEMQKTKVHMVVKKAEPPTEVVLFEQYPAFDVCINAMLVNDGHAESTGESSTTLKWSKSNETTQQPESFPVKLFQSQTSGAESMNVIQNDNRTYQEVSVLNVDDPDRIYVSINNSTLMQQKMQLFKALQIYYGSQTVSTTIFPVDSHCVVFHKKQKMFVRAIVTNLREEKYEVLLYDLGENLDVPKDTVWELNEKFEQVPSFAVKCHLANITPAGDRKKWSHMAIELLKDVFKTQTRIYVTKDGLIDTERKSMPVIMLYTEFVEGGPLEKSTYNYININKMLVDKGLAFKKNRSDSSEETTATNTNTSDSVLGTPDVKNDLPFVIETIDLSEDWNDIIAADQGKIGFGFCEYETDQDIGDWPAPLPLQAREFDATATYVDHDGGIYLYDSKLEPVIKMLECEMKKIFDTTAPEPAETVWKVGDLCTVRYFANANWYRGKILKLLPNALHIRMVDYGNDEECKLEDVRKKIICTDIPLLVNKVYLYGLPQRTSDWSTLHLDFLHALVVDKNVYVQIQTKSAAKKQLAFVYIGGKNVNDMLLEKVALDQKEDSPSPMDDDDDDVILENEMVISLNSSLESMQVSTYSYVPLPDDKEVVNVVVVNVVHFNEIIFECMDTVHNDNDFKEMSSDVDQNAELQPIVEVCYEGLACVARFDDDGKWYRAEIANIDNMKANGTVCVRFVDFGNFAHVPVENIRMPKPKWFELPLEQYVAKLHNIELSDESALHEVVAHFESYYNTLQRAKIISKEPLAVELYELSEDRLLYQVLLDKNLIHLVS